MLQKISTVPKSTRLSSERLDNFIHAMALVILRRQMRGKWMMTPPATAAH